MKAQEADRITVRSGINNTKNYRVEIDSKLFSILYSSVYTDKVGAVVRELCANAYDAQVEAGNTQPFHVILPSQLHREFVVEDFGVGMDADTVDRVYSAYGVSTKRDSNDLIGSFGIGSKSPFACSDMFSVRTRKDGIERCYMNYIDDKGLPCISKLSESPTTEHDGTRISVPVKPSDEGSFLDAAKKYVPPYGDAAACRAVESKTHAMKFMERWGICPDCLASFGSRSVVIMGHVPYAIPFDIRVGVTLLAPIGSLTVTASREDIEDTKQNRNTIAKLLHDAHRLIHSSLPYSAQSISAINDVISAYGRDDYADLVKLDQLLDYSSAFIITAGSSLKAKKLKLALLRISFRATGAQFGLANGEIIFVTGHLPKYKRKRVLALLAPCSVALNEEARHFAMIEPIMRRLFPQGDNIHWTTYDDVIKINNVQFKRYKSNLAIKRKPLIVRCCKIDNCAADDEIIRIQADETLVITNQLPNVYHLSGTVGEAHKFDYIARFILHRRPGAVFYVATSSSQSRIRKLRANGWSHRFNDYTADDIEAIAAYEFHQSVRAHHVLASLSALVNGGSLNADVAELRSMLESIKDEYASPVVVTEATAVCNAGITAAVKRNQNRYNRLSGEIDKIYPGWLLISGINGLNSRSKDYVTVCEQAKMYRMEHRLAV